MQLKTGQFRAVQSNFVYLQGQRSHSLSGLLFQSFQPTPWWFLFLICNQNSPYCKLWLLSLVVHVCLQKYSGSVCSIQTQQGVTDYSNSSLWIPLLEINQIQHSNLFQPLDHCGDLPWIHSNMWMFSLYCGHFWKGSHSWAQVPSQSKHDNCTRRQDSLFLAFDQIVLNKLFL